MQTVDFETAIAEFLALGRCLQDAQDLCGERVLDELCRWYLGTRVEGRLPTGWVRTCCCCSGERPAFRCFLRPSTRTSAGDGELKHEDQNRRYLDFTRQLFVVKGACRRGGHRGRG